MSEKFTGAEILIKSLIDQGVDQVFGYPGGQIMLRYTTVYMTIATKYAIISRAMSKVPYMLPKGLLGLPVKPESYLQRLVPER